MDYLKATRKMYVETVDIRYSKPGDPLHFQDFDNSKPPREMWTVWVTTRNGLLPKKLTTAIFYTEAEALDFANKYPAGSEIEDKIMTDLGRVEYYRPYIEEMMDKNSSFLGISDAGDEESSLAFEVLENAGIRDKGCGVTKKVIDFLGESRVKSLKDMHYESWCSAAAFEYCWLNLSHSSAAFVAARYQFHHYISQDDFSAGYLWRDLENLVHGVEAAAFKTFEMRKKAGAAGSERSAMARDARRAALMDAMINVAMRNPDIVKLGEKSVATLALTDSVSTDPALWRQGAGQVHEYIGEIRRGEAGPELQLKYHSIFPQKPPKRFP